MVGCAYTVFDVDLCNEDNFLKKVGLKMDLTLQIIFVIFSYS